MCVERTNGKFFRRGGHFPNKGRGESNQGPSRGAEVNELLNRGSLALGPKRGKRIDCPGGNRGGLWSSDGPLREEKNHECVQKGLLSSC